MVAGHLQEKKGYYYIVLNYKDKTGKYKSKWKSTGLPVKGNKKKAEAMLLEARQAHDDAPVAAGDEIMFTRFMENWLDMVKPNIEQTTYASYSYNIKTVINPYFKDRAILLSNLQPKHIQDFYTYCLNEREVSATSVIRYHANIRKALKYAVDTDLIPSNPADKVQRPKQRKYVGKFYDVDEINDLLSIIRGTLIELPVMLAAFYGLRRSEALGLKWSAIDFKNNTITICHTVTETMIDGKITRVSKDRTKNKSSHRSLPLVDEFAVMLTRLKEKRDENMALCKNAYNADGLEYLCVDDLGNLVKPGYVTQNFTLTLARNNMRRIRFHDLRHSYVRECFFNCVIGLTPENNGDTITTANQGNAEVRPDARCGMYGRAS